MPTSINLGKIRPVDKGEWSSTYEGGYDILDIVTSGKGSYMSKVKPNTFALTDRTKWIPLVDSAAIELAIQEAMDAAAEANAAREAIEGDINSIEVLVATQSSKIKDIENVLSTANLNQSAQLSVSGRKVVSLPKNASNGGMQVKLEGLTAENLVVKGDFRNGLTGWRLYAPGAALAIEGDYLTYISNNQGQAIEQTGKSFATGDKLYVYAIMKVDETFTGMTAGVALSAVGAILLPSVTVGVTDTVVRGIITAQSNLTSIIFGRADTVNKKVYLKKGARVVNLTATFGAGNEPTVEECDAIFGEYFEGVKSFEPTGRVRSVDKGGLNPTHLYLTAPELRSNGAAKDEIRKVANGYELVKRVGVGTLGGELVTNGGFDTDTWWTKGADWSIANGVASKSNPASTTDLTSPSIITANTWYVVTLEVKNYVSGSIYLVFSGASSTRSPLAISNGIETYLVFSANAAATMTIRGQSFVGSVDNISVKKLTIQDDAPLNISIPRVYNGMALYTLATPVITPISYGGILNSAENGTVYHEPIIADAGVYDTKMDILLTDYPITSIEEIIKHEDGVDTYLNAATAVIAGDGLSFTHPDLASGGLVLFTYAFDKESTNGNITATFYDSNVVKIDTVTGKAYRINEVVTNGVLTRTLTEV